MTSKNATAKADAIEDAAGAYDMEALNFSKGQVWESTPPVYTYTGELIDGYVSHEGETCKGEALAGVLVSMSARGTIHATVFTDGVVLDVFGYNHMPRTVHFVGATESDVLSISRKFVGDVPFYGTSPERPYRAGTDNRPTKGHTSWRTT